MFLTLLKSVLPLSLFIRYSASIASGKNFYLSLDENASAILSFAREAGPFRITVDFLPSQAPQLFLS
jgi:hypothetical protein